MIKNSSGKKLYSFILILSLTICQIFVLTGCGEKNDPIDLTVDNIEDYVDIDFYISNLDKSTKLQRITLVTNVYTFDIIGESKPFVNAETGESPFYFEDAEIQVDWYCDGDDNQTDTYHGSFILDLDSEGRGSDSREMYAENYKRSVDFESEYGVDRYEIIMVQGKVYPHNPNE